MVLIIGDITYRVGRLSDNCVSKVKSKVCLISILDQVAGAAFIHVQSEKERREHMLLYTSNDGYHFPSRSC